MTQPYGASALFWIVVAFLIALTGLTICLLIGLKRLLCRLTRRWLCRRRTERTARQILARTDFDTALAKLTKENGR